MRIRVPHYYKEFKCVGPECTDTCCAGWEVVIDEESYQYYKTVSGDFGERLKATMISAEDDENTFVLKNGNCSFLNEKKLCDIYTQLGEDKLCNTCKLYPRFVEEFGNLREIGISLSCPEAARLILKNYEPIIFDIEKNEEMITTYNDIEPELFMQLLSSRKIAMEMLQNRSLPINHRIALLLTFAYDIQEKIDKDELSQIADVKNQYLKDDFTEHFMKGLDKYKDKRSLKYKNMSKYMSVYRNLEKINDQWPKIIDHDLECLHGTDDDGQFYAKQYADFNTYYQNQMYEYEHLMVYFMFRYFMEAVYDQDLYYKVKLAAVSFLMIKELNIVSWIDHKYTLEKADQIDIMHMYSKEIEHSEKNLGILANEFQTNEIFDLEQLMVMLMN